MTPRVMILDDHASLRRNLRAMLEDEGFEVMEAGSGEQALQIVKNARLDAVIVDIRLPGMSGDEFITSAHLIKPQLYFIIHTGAADYLLPDNLRRIGLTEESIFLKPLSDPDVLFSLLRNITVE